MRIYGQSSQKTSKAYCLSITHSIESNNKAQVFDKMDKILGFAGNKSER